jgi:hypothetical protein
MARLDGIGAARWFGVTGVTVALGLVVFVKRESEWQVMCERAFLEEYRQAEQETKKPYRHPDRTVVHCMSDHLVSFLSI